MVRVLMVDRDDVIREGIQAVLTREIGNVRFDEARTSVELIASLAAQDFDLIVVEPLLGTQKCDDIIKQVHTLAPRSNILVFTTLDECSHGAQAIRCGAKGYLMKTCSVDDFLTAIRRLRAGKTYMSTSLAEFLARCPRTGTSPYDNLSKRELEIYSMLVCGKRVVEIASLLKLSQKTISTHKARIMSKFHFRTFTDMVHHAVSSGLLDECRLRLANFDDATFRLKKSCFSDTNIQSAS